MNTKNRLAALINYKLFAFVTKYRKLNNHKDSYRRNLTCNAVYHFENAQQNLENFIKFSYCLISSQNSKQFSSLGNFLTIVYMSPICNPR